MTFKQKFASYKMQGVFFRDSGTLFSVSSADKSITFYPEVHLRAAFWKSVLYMRASSAIFSLFF